MGKLKYTIGFSLQCLFGILAVVFGAVFHNSIAEMSFAIISTACFFYTIIIANKYYKKP